MLPQTRLATSWGGLARSIQLLCLLPLAASLSIVDVNLGEHARQCDFASSSRYSVHPDAKPSGDGKLWEYYHFLIDFAPDILYEMRDDRAPCKWFQVPGWHHDGKFELTLPGQPQRSMEAHFEFLLGEPLNLTMAVVDNRQTFEETARSTSTPTRMLQWNCHSAAEWVGFPAEYYTGFRDYARALPGVPPAQRKDIVVVKRLTLQTYNGPTTGCARRCLDESFYDSLLKYSQSHGYDTAVVALEGQSVAGQISVFSDVKVVIAQHGAALSNIIFARPGTLVIEIGHRNFPCYTRLSEKLGLPYIHYESEDYSDEVAQAINEGMATQVQGVIKRFVMADRLRLGAQVRCPSLATCVGQQFQ